MELEKIQLRGYTTIWKCKPTILSHEFEPSKVACMYLIQMGQFREKNTEELIGLTQTDLPFKLLSFKAGSCHEQMMCSHIVCEFEIRRFETVQYKNINKISLYAQNLK